MAASDSALLSVKQNKQQENTFKQLVPCFYMVPYFVTNSYGINLIPKPAKTQTE